MRIGILTTSTEPEGDQRLIEAGEEKGHTVELLNSLKCSIRACADKPTVFYDGEDISERFDAIIPRLDIPDTKYGQTILRQFQALDVYTTDTAFSIGIARDKLRCFQYLMRAGVPLPKTGFAWSKNDFDTIIEAVGGAPVVLKVNEGTEGYGVFLANEARDARNFLATFKNLEAEIVVQEYIGESSGQDIRCHVIGDKVISTFERVSTNGDFRANIAQGGVAHQIKLTAAEEEIAIRAAAAMGLNVAGVDLIRSERGVLILEVNPSSYFTAFLADTDEGLKGKAFAREFIQYLEKNKAAYDRGEGVWLDPDIADPREALKVA